MSLDAKIGRVFQDSSRRPTAPAPRQAPDRQRVATPTPGPDAAEASTLSAVLVRLADVRPEPIRWLWPGRIPLGKVSLLCGDPSLGKSIVSLDMAARVSRGVPWPDRRDEANPPRGVVIVSAEDDLNDTIRPRLDAAGADVSRVVALQGVRYADDDGATATRTFTLHDLSVLDDAIHRTPECRLVIVDPITAYLAGVDSHKNADVRAILAPLADLAARFKVAVVCVTHLSKAPGRPAMYRASGSLAFIAAARAAWLFVPDKNQPGRRLIVSLKSNLSAERTGLAYRIEPGGGAFDAPIVAWEADPVTMTADEALSAAEAAALRPGRRDDAVEWLGDLLATGPMPVETIREQAKAAGLSWPTIRRAKDTLGVVAKRSGFGPGGSWVWELPRIVAQGAIDAQPLTRESCAPMAGAIENAVLDGQDSIDAQGSNVSTYGKDEHLCPESDADVPELVLDSETGEVVGTDRDL